MEITTPERRRFTTGGNGCQAASRRERAAHFKVVPAADDRGPHAEVERTGSGDPFGSACVDREKALCDLGAIGENSCDNGVDPKSASESQLSECRWVQARQKKETCLHHAEASHQWPQRSANLLAVTCVSMHDRTHVQTPCHVRRRSRVVFVFRPPSRLPYSGIGGHIRIAHLSTLVAVPSDRCCRQVVVGLCEFAAPCRQSVLPSVRPETELSLHPSPPALAGLNC